MILSANFAMIAWLVVVVRMDPGTTNPFPSLLDAFQINIKALFLTFCCFSKAKTKKMSPVPNKRPVSNKHPFMKYRRYVSASARNRIIAA